MVAIDVQNLVKSYREHTALKGISFHLAQGETFVLLGPNGAGKSTTIEILEGTRSRTAGEVRVLGVDPQTAGPSFRTSIGVVQQTSNDTWQLPMRYVLTHYAGLYPNPRNVDDVLAAVGLDALANRPIAKLSGGQRRRFEVALGIVGNPKMLFLDEPTTGFDPEIRREFWQLIKTLQYEGMSILLTTHYLDEADELGHRGAIIIDGQFVTQGKISELGGPEARTPIVSWREAGAFRSERSTRPLEVASAIADRLGAAPTDLQIQIPTLEEVYLNLINQHREDA